MNFNMNKSKIALTSALLLSATAFAAESQEVVNQQKSLLEKLDSLNAAVLGLKLNGTAKAGALASMASSDQFTSASPTQENQAYTDVNLKVTARPSAETMVDVQLRLHKDWQSAYDENNNPVIGHWFSYDGTILNKHVNFNLGDMRVGYTPLTIFTPQPELLQEPEVFSEKRTEALARRNLDTTSRRLMSGLNVEYQSGEVAGVIDNITAQLTGARMRNTAKKIDQVFFDFDFSDRYLLGARVGAEAYGARLGANFVEVSDRKLTRRSRDMASDDVVFYDDNRVISAQLGFNSNKLMPDLPVTFGVNVEFAMSNWKLDKDFMGPGVNKENYALTQVIVGADTVVYVASELNLGKDALIVYNQKLFDEDGKALQAELFVNGDIADVEFNFSGMYLQNDKEFWSEMASTPTYQGGSVVLNANALYSGVDSLLMSSFGSSSLENLYFNVYNSTTLNATNLMTSGSTNTLSDQDESSYLYTRLDNNYKNGHFYRNGYSASVMKKSELEAQKALSLMDPTVGLAMPYGLATPNRKGLAIKLDAKWNDAVALNARFNMLTETDAIDFEATNAATIASGIYTPVLTDNKYTEFAVGIGVDAGRLANLGREITIQGSFANGKENSSYKRTSTRIIAGLKADVWGPISVLGGFQSHELKFDNPFGIGNESGLTAAITKTKETLILGGVRVKIASGAFASLQYGMLKNELDYVSGVSAGKLSVDKNVIAGDVTVNF